MLSLFACSGGFLRAASRSKAYPNRPIDLIVPWAAGGGSDRVARFTADALHRRMGQPVIVINRTGGSGAVGHTAGALAAPDGYTLTLATFELSTMRSMAISPLAWTNFTPVAQINADAAAIIVRHDAPWNTLPALLEAIRRGPRRLKFSGTATGGAWDLARSGLLLAAGIPATNVIWAPTQGSAPALVELLGGHIDVVSCSVPEAAAQLEGGQARVLAVMSPQRLPLFPEYATAREQGVAYDAVGWRGIMLPRNAPAEVVARLNRALVEIAHSDEFAAFMKKNGFTTEVRAAGEFATYLAEQEAKWQDVIRLAGYDTLGQNNADPGPRALPIALAVVLALSLAGEVAATRRRAAADRTGENGKKSLLSGEPSKAVDVAAGSDPRLPGEACRTGVPGIFSGPPAFWLLTLGLVAYGLALTWTGFVISTSIFATALMWRQGVVWWQAGLASAVLVAGIYLLFETAFKVQLP